MFGKMLRGFLNLVIDIHDGLVSMFQKIKEWVEEYAGFLLILATCLYLIFMFENHK